MSQSVMIVASTAASSDFLSAMLAGTGYQDITVCTSGAQARRQLLQKEYALLLINAPLPDEQGHELAAQVVQNCDIGAVLFVKNEYFSEFSSHLAPHGVSVLPKPISKVFFLEALKLMEASAYRLYALKNENKKLKNKLEEARVVDRAKCFLIQYKSMSEQQAHRFIEKQAMDQRRSRKEIATAILDNQDDL